MTAQLCPRCEENYFTPIGEPRIPGTSYPAWSRADREGDPERTVDELLWVCDECGAEEAVVDAYCLAMIDADNGFN
jgi:hypothetical protein